MEQLSFFSIEKKIQNAITLLKMFEAKAIEMHPEGYYLCFSGGKDSQVIYELAKQAKVKFQAYYNVTTVDPPELVYFIRKMYPAVIINQPDTTMWELISQKHYPPTRRITQMPGMVYPYNLKNVFKGTPFEYCSLDYFVKNNRFVELPVVYYLKTYLKFPLLEQFVKQNMFYIALECLYQLPNEWEETKETNTRHFLGINSRYCSILSKYNMGIKEWGVLQKMEKLKIHLSEQEIFAYCKIFESNRDFLELNQYASIRKIVNYLAKQIEKEEKGKAYKLSGDVSGISHVEMKCYQTYIRSWKDYIEWAEKLEYDLKSRYVLFPKNFKDVHDKTFLEYQKQQDKMERRKQAKERRTVNQLLKKDIKLLDTKIQDKDYLLKVPENCQEIRKEGQALGHCVGSYIPHIANRECDVYFIRKKTDPDKPFFTVDWRRGKIVQCQGKGRIRYPQEMVEFVHYAEEKLRLLKGEEEKKAA